MGAIITIYARMLAVAVRDKDLESFIHGLRASGIGMPIRAETEDGVSVLNVLFSGADGHPDDAAAVISHWMEERIPIAVSPNRIRAAEKLRTFAGRWPD